MSAKYAYALDKNNNIVHINDVTIERRESEQFHCIGCGEPLTACLGKVRNHYFRHTRDISCNGETYLHLLGKRVFKETYEDCLKNGKPFEITMMLATKCSDIETCGILDSDKKSESPFSAMCTKKEQKTYDLTQYYHKLEIEKPFGSVIPDLTLLSDNPNRKPIFIEIKVTHACDISKINLKKPIIELTIEQESDIEIIKSCHLEPTNRYYKEGNFSEKSSTSNDERTQCTDKKVTFYNFSNLWKAPLHLHQRMHFWVEKKTLQCELPMNEIFNCNEENDIIEQHRIQGQYSFEIFFSKEDVDQFTHIFGVALARENSIPLKSCYLCLFRHIEYNNYDRIRNMFCMLDNNRQIDNTCHITQAKSCPSYKLSRHDYLPFLDLCHQYRIVDYR